MLQGGRHFWEVGEVKQGHGHGYEYEYNEELRFLEGWESSGRED